MSKNYYLASGSPPQNTEDKKGSTMTTSSLVDFKIINKLGNYCSINRCFQVRVHTAVFTR
jgi:hypothetical protein